MQKTEDAIRETIVDRFAEGEDLGELLREIGVKFQQFRRWRKTILDFDSAMEAAQDCHSEAKLSLLATALDRYPNPQAAKVFSDNIRWQLSKLDPARFGDRLDVNHKHTVDLTEAFARALDRIQAPVLAPTLHPSLTLDMQRTDDAGAFSIITPDRVSGAQP